MMDAQAKETEGAEVTICGCFLNQPIGNFFVGAIPSAVLRKMASAQIRRFLGMNEGEEIYQGYQRELRVERVKEITNYIGSVDATFPNSIIIAVSSEYVLDQTRNSITLRVTKDTASIIDGQHRVAGFTDTNDSDFDLPVSIFIDMDIEDQASIFSTINLKQAKVSKSLVYDLFSLEKAESPQKTCHDIARSVNFDKESPFYRRIKLLGVNPRLSGETKLYEAPLSQATFIKYLMKTITKDAEADRDILKRNKARSSLSLQPDFIEQGLIFRNYFIQNEDAVILRILLNYFRAVEQVFPDEWHASNNPLSRTIGYGALMTLLQKDIFPLGRSQGAASQAFFAESLSKAKGKIVFSFEKYAPAGAGESHLYRDLKEIIRA